MWKGGEGTKEGFYLGCFVKYSKLNYSVESLRCGLIRNKVTLLIFRGGKVVQKDTVGYQL